MAHRKRDFIAGTDTTGVGEPLQRTGLQSGLYPSTTSKLCIQIPAQRHNVAVKATKGKREQELGWTSVSFEEAK